MKILKNGKIPQPILRLFRGTCPNCGCEVECNEQEAQYVTDRRIGAKPEWFTTCPFKIDYSYECKTKIILTEVRKYPLIDALAPLLSLRSAVPTTPAQMDSSKLVAAAESLIGENVPNLSDEEVRHLAKRSAKTLLNALPKHLSDPTLNEIIDEYLVKQRGG